MSSVTFDYDEFIARFVHIGQAVAEGKLTEASVTAAYDSIASWQGADDDNSIYPYDPENGITLRKDVLYLMTCHVLTLQLWAGSGQSGRIASASQGSISTSFDLLKSNKDIPNYWFQTPCGQQFWIMTAAYRKGGRFYGVRHYHPWG